MKVYKYEERFGRMGTLSGVFIADDVSVGKARGKTVYSANTPELKPRSMTRT